MNQNSSCIKVTKLLALYIDNKLDKSSYEFVKSHLKTCPECYQKYLMLKELIYELRTAYNKLINHSKKQAKTTQFNIKEYENFQTNVSAYFDNELPLNESVKMKKYMIKYPNARKELEEIYNLHTHINSSYLSVKRFFNTDFSKKICYKLQGKPENYQKLIYFKIASYAGLILTIAALTFAILPVGRTVIEKQLKKINNTIYVENIQHQELAGDLQE